MDGCWPQDANNQIAGQRRFPHLDNAASLAMATRLLAESFLALAFPPFNPPNFPKIAAAEETFPPIDFGRPPRSRTDRSK